MSHVFISYARSTAKEAQAVATALRGLGHEVWLDDEIPARRAYADVIEERLKAANAVVVIWSAEAVKSQWVQSEADRAREDGKLVQLNLDGAKLPMPFDRIQCVDLSGWSGAPDHPGWRKIVSSITDLVGGGSTVADAATTEEPALALPAKPSIAVMPFANLSGDPEQDYFADGMVVEIAEALSRFRSIFVIASGSTLALKGKGVGPREAAGQLGVRYVLEGTVRKAGGRVRIGVQLVDCAGGAPLWTERFEGTLEDVFALQDEVAQRVAGVIEPEVQEAEIRRARARPTDSLSAYDLYLRAFAEVRTMERTRIEAALPLLERALAIDPDFGPALAAVAICHEQIAFHRWSDDPKSEMDQALAFARRAAAVAGDDAEVLARAAIVMTTFGEADDARRLADRAWSLNPASLGALIARAGAHLHRGEIDAALEVLDAAARLEPVGRSGPIQLMQAMALFEQKRFREAATLLRDRRAGSAVGYAFLASCYGHLGEAALARDALANVAARTTGTAEEMGHHFPMRRELRALFGEGIALAQAMAANA